MNDLQLAREDNEMKIALAVWQERISPVFDVSRSLLLVQLSQDAREERREMVGLEAVTPSQRVVRLTALGIETLICGAVSAPLAEMILASGIRLIPFVAGASNEVLAAFLHGKLPSPTYAQPGCNGRRQRCRGGWILQ